MAHIIAICLLLLTPVGLSGTKPPANAPLPSAREQSIHPTNTPLQVRNKDWKAARVLSDELNAYIANASGTATLEDIRRWVESGAALYSAGIYPLDGSWVRSAILRSIFCSIR